LQDAPHGDDQRKAYAIESGAVTCDACRTEFARLALLDDLPTRLD